MEEISIRQCDSVFPGYSWLYFQAPTNHRSADVAGVSVPCGQVIYPGVSFYFPRVVADIEVRRDFGTGDRTISSSGAVELVGFSGGSSRRAPHFPSLGKDKVGGSEGGVGYWN